MTVVEWQKQREHRAKEQRVTCVWISSLMECLVSCFFFTASRSTKGRMVMPCRGTEGLHLCPRHSGGSGTGSVSLCSVLGMWGSGRGRDGGWGGAPHSLHGHEELPFPHTA